MAFPTVLARSGGTESSNTREHRITVPAAMAAASLVLVVIGVDGTPSLGTSSGGWRFLGQRGNNSVLGVFAAIAGSATGLTVAHSGTSEQSAHNSYEITGWSGDLDDLAVAFDNGDANDYATLPTLAPPHGEHDYLWVGAVATYSGARWADGPPPGFSEFVNRRTGSSSSNGNIASAERSYRAAELAPGAMTLASNGGDYAATTIAVPPAMTSAVGPEPGRHLLVT